MTAPLLALVAAARFEDLPKPVVEIGRLALLDWWGVTVAGAAEPVARLVREVVDEAGDGRCAVLGTTARELAAKFQELVAPRVGGGVTARLREALLRVDDLEDIGELARPVP